MSNMEVGRSGIKPYFNHQSLPSLVEDFVFSTDGDNLGLNFNSSHIIFAGANLAGVIGMVLAIPVYTIIKVAVIELKFGYSQYHIFKN